MTPTIQVACPYCEHMETVSMQVASAEKSNEDLDSLMKTVKSAAGVKADYAFEGSIRCQKCNYNIFVTVQVSAVESNDNT